MTMSSLTRVLCLAAAFAACTLPAQAASTTASSASSAGSASSGSVSDSIGSSSNSGGDERVAAGQYRVIDLAQAPGKPDTTRMTLRPVAGAGPATHEFHLDVPNRALAQRPLAQGALVQVNEREYGYEFAHADTQQSFFLALEDAWYRELGSAKVAI